MDLCLVVVTILISVPSSPNAPGRRHRALPHQLIIVDTDVVSFAEQPTISQPEKREYTRVFGHNIDVFNHRLDRLKI